LWVTNTNDEFMTHLDAGLYLSEKWQESHALPFEPVLKNSIWMIPRSSFISIKHSHGHRGKFTRRWVHDSPWQVVSFSKGRNFVETIHVMPNYYSNGLVVVYQTLCSLYICWCCIPCRLCTLTLLPSSIHHLSITISHLFLRI
jgi:hypothetical protein